MRFMMWGGNIGGICEHRKGTGIDKDSTYIEMANYRLKAVYDGKLSMCKSGKAPRKPNPNERVAKVPEDWLQPRPARNSD